MKTKHVESLEDLVFRDKNKLYGAYFLRMRYQRYITLSLIFATFLFLSALTYPLIASYRFKGAINSGDKTVTGEYIKHPPADITPPAPLPPPPTPLKKFIFTVPTIVDSIKGDDDFGKQDLLAQNKTIEPPPPDDNIIPDDNPGKKTIDVPEPPEPPTWVPEMPVFPGGESELYHYLNKNLEYPDVAKESNISGTVYLTFVVEKDGSISDVKILRGIGGGCDEEAIRVVKSMPPWTPGKNNGTPVRVRFNLPVKFTLQ